MKRIQVDDEMEEHTRLDQRTSKQLSLYGPFLGKDGCGLQDYASRVQLKGVTLIDDEYLAQLIKQPPTGQVTQDEMFNAVAMLPDSLRKRISMDMIRQLTRSLNEVKGFK